MSKQSSNEDTVLERIARGIESIAVNIDKIRQLREMEFVEARKNETKYSNYVSDFIKKAQHSNEGVLAPINFN